MVQHRPKSRWLRKALLAGVIAAAIAITGATIHAGGFRQLLASDPPRADYDWLRRGLRQAEDVADAALKGTRQAGRRAAVEALKSAIRYSRASARSTGTEPIPEAIREQLQDFFPDHILDDVHWAYSNQYLDLGTVITAWYRAEGGAVTLEDTIIFSTPYAASRRFLWAHELTHAVQYDELGLADFARIYVTNPKLLEDQAWENARRIERAIQRSARKRRAIAAKEPAAAAN